MKLLINFMPLANQLDPARRADDLPHPLLASRLLVWREQGRRVRVRYHPEDLSRIFASADGRNHVELAARHSPLRTRHLGIWFALLCWRLWGFNGNDSIGMREFRRFQRALPMPNCAVYGLEQAAKVAMATAGG